MGENEPVSEDYMAPKTIFAQFDRSTSLASILERCASKRGKQVYWGEPGSPDLLAVPSFLAIIDRMDVGLYVYEHYIELAAECSVKDPDEDDQEADTGMLCSCIVIDECRDLPLPMLPAVIYLDPANPLLGEWLDQVIVLALATYLQA